jgi:carbon monoxide dehydrogenase subunit G
MMGEERMAAAPDRVWQALNDARILRQCIPGCQSLESESADRLRAIVEIKIGPIGARFNATVTLRDIRPERGYTLIGEGQGGTIGSAKATIKIQLQQQGAATLLSYEVDAQVGGRLAQLGGPIIDATAKQFAARFFKQFGEVIGGTAPSASTKSAALHASPAPATHAAPPISRSSPLASILAVVVAALVGFLIGRGQSDGSGSDWMGLAIGLLLIVVAAAAFEFGRRTAAPQIVVDAALIQRLLRGEKE